MLVFLISLIMTGSRGSVYSIMGRRNTHDESMFCNCGESAPLKTSWSTENPGRRYWSCPFYGTNEKCCKFFIWKDPKTCERGKAFGNKLILKVSRLEREVMELRSKRNSYSGKSEVEKEYFAKRCSELEEKYQIVKAELLSKERRIGILKKIVVALCIVVIVLIMK